MKKPNPHIVGIILIILHLAGLIGYSLEPTRPLFLWLTPFNLIICAVTIVFYNSKPSTASMVVFMVVALAGFLVEVMGVKTGQPFGAYFYEGTLGIKVWGVPLVLGANWLMMIYFTAALGQLLMKRNKWAQIIMASLLMVAFDFLIEPVAIKYDYWQWLAHDIPIQNYIAWFVISFGMHTLFSFFICAKTNVVAFYLAGSQLIFFLTLNLL